MEESIQQHANHGTSLDAERLHSVSHYHALNSKADVNHRFRGLHMDGVCPKTA